MLTVEKYHAVLEKIALGVRNWSADNSMSSVPVDSLMGIKGSYAGLAQGRTAGGTVVHPSGVAPPGGWSNPHPTFPAVHQPLTRDEPVVSTGRNPIPMLFDRGMGIQGSFPNITRRDGMSVGWTAAGTPVYGPGVQPPEGWGFTHEAPRPTLRPALKPTTGLVAIPRQ